MSWISTEKFNLYASRTYNFVTFVSACIVLLISIVIIVVSGLAYHKVKDIMKTVNNVEGTVNTLNAEVKNLNATGITTTIMSIIEAIIKAAGLRTLPDEERRQLETWLLSYTHSDLQLLNYRLQRHAAPSSTSDNDMNTSEIVSWLKLNKFIE